MGHRGPLTGTAYGLKTGPKTESDMPDAQLDLPDHETIPAPPSHLTEDGQQVWRLVLSGVRWRKDVDLLAVARFTELFEERQLARAALLQHGMLQTEPIVTPRGDVVGQRLTANPAVSILASTDRSLDSLSAQLGLSPAARARLGLEATAAELKAAEIERVLSSKRRDPSELH